jgi:Trp operon repressor
MNQDGWDSFLEFCISKQDKKRLSSLFDLILTAPEKESVATCCLILKELLVGEKPQRQISKRFRRLCCQNA